MKKSFCFFILVLLCSPLLIGQEQKVDVIDFVKEIQQIKKEGSTMTMVWWIPTLYWEIATKDSPLVTEEAIRQIVETVDDYFIAAAFEGNIRVGGISYADSISIKLIDSDNIEYLPLGDENVPDQTKTLLNTLKPFLASAMGKMGEKIEFYVFPKLKGSGDAIADPKQKGKFQVLLNHTNFKWNLPLGVLVPKKICKEDGELLNGSWEYCPWHGNKLKNHSN